MVPSCRKCHGMRLKTQRSWLSETHMVSLGHPRQGEPETLAATWMAAATLMASIVLNRCTDPSNAWGQKSDRQCPGSLSTLYLPARQVPRPQTKDILLKNHLEVCHQWTVQQVAWPKCGLSVALRLLVLVQGKPGLPSGSLRARVKDPHAVPEHMCRGLCPGQVPCLP